jgi:RNA polymerase sigma-70 factor (ECF subfamily)
VRARMTGRLGSRAEEDAAFTELVSRHARFLYRVALSLLRNGPDAEDAVQDALLKLYRGRAWMEMSDERAFLARTVWRVGLDRLGTAGAKAMRNAEDVSAINLESGAKGPEEVAMETDERRLMRDMIEALPEEFRQPLVLSAIEGMRSSEVAAVMGIPEGTVRTRVLRAKERLREAFQASLLARGAVRAEVLP